MYAEHLARVPGEHRGCAGCACRTYATPEVTCMSWFVYVIRVYGDELSGDEPNPERQSAVRDHVMRPSQEAGIGRRPYFTPIHLQPFYRAELAGRTSIAIPFHNHLTAEEIDYVADVLEPALP